MVRSVIAASTGAITNRKCSRSATLFVGSCVMQRMLHLKPTNGSVARRFDLPGGDLAADIEMQPRTSWGCSVCT